MRAPLVARSVHVGVVASLAGGVLALLLAAAIVGSFDTRGHSPVTHHQAGPRRAAASSPAGSLNGAADSLGAVPMPGGFMFRDARQHLVARVGASGVSVRSGGVALGLRLSGYGYGDRLRDVRDVAPRRERSGLVAYRRGALTEWYANRPEGLEQGFTLAAAPTGARAGRLTLALDVSGNARGGVSHGRDAVMFTRADRSLAYRGLVATDATGHRLSARLELDSGRLLLEVDDRRARYPLRIDPTIEQASSSDPYGQAVLADKPSLYLRLDDPAGSIALDTSGNGDDGTYEPGASFGAGGPLVSDPSDSAVALSSGTAVTQSGAGLPSGKSARTVEFWWRTSNCYSAPYVNYGGSGVANDAFDVVLGGCSARNGATGRGLQLLTEGQSFLWALPTTWFDGRWHLFDVTYDGTTATAYMDGQVVGSSPVATPLATVTPGNGFGIGDAQNDPNAEGEDDVAEAAVYPTALTPTQVDSHWSAGASASAACPAAPTDAYGEAVASDSPSLYLRLGDVASDRTDRVAHDFAGHCNGSGPANGAFAIGVGAQPDGPLLGYEDGAVALSSGTAVTQSGAGLPSGKSARTVEFWWRTSNCYSAPYVNYGGSGVANDAFDVVLGGCSARNGATGRGLQLLTEGQSFLWALPTTWFDGRWHLFDVTYDGTTATAYMDGQVVGSSPVATPLATVTPGNGFGIGDAQNDPNAEGEDDVAEAAVYPTALSSKRIDAHWEARSATPPGTSLIGGTATVVGGGGAPGARAQACPTSGASCIADANAANASGFFHILVPDGTYTVTVFPPYGSPFVPQTIPDVTVPPSALSLAATFSLPGGPLATGATFSSPSTGPQENVVPRVNWGEPSTYTVTGCPNGFGVLDVSATNTNTGSIDDVSHDLVESPAGSGSYVAQIPPLVPLHGSATVSPTIACVGRSALFPTGGPPGGGTSVVLTGSGFMGATGVSFASSAAQSFKVIDDHVIVATSPPGSDTEAVTVTASNGTTISAGEFSYFSVAGLSTPAGPATGGTSVAIHGSGFSNVQSVLFGIVPAQSYTVVSSTEIDAVAPAGVGTVDVQVTSGQAPSELGPSSTFTYEGGMPDFVSIHEGFGPNAVQGLAGQISRFCANQTDWPFTPSQICSAAGFIIRHVPQFNPNTVGPGTVGVGGLAIAALRAAIPICDTEIIGCAALIGAVIEAAPYIVGVAAAVAVGVAVYELLRHFNPFGLFIDPSGTVVDTTGNPIDGATATLLGQPGAEAPFSPVDPSSGAIEPATNPQTTTSTGAFDWDALAGTYEVEASAPGCYAPGDTGHAAVFTSPFAIPPPLAGLMLTLECPGSTPVKPTVTGLSPSEGPTVGGDMVDITGTGLAGATSVSFGGQPVTHMQVLSPYAITAIAPAGSSTVHVTVTTQGGTSPTTAADQYTYAAPAVVPDGPVITNVAPASGALAGGTVVTINGMDLDGAYGVDFGGRAATSVTDVSPTELQAVAPAAAFASRVDVSVTTPVGTSAPTLGDAFVYGSPPPPVTTALTAAASPNPAAVGSQVGIAADVTPTDGAGRVAFYADGSAAPVIGCEAVALTQSGSAYEATCTTSTLAPGNHTITAAYSGDANYAASSGSGSVMVLGIPADTAPPTIAGTPQSGQTLACSPGTWSNSPTGYSYQWQRDGGDIAGATSATYAVQGADLGHTVTCRVTATNIAGSATAMSAGVAIPRALTAPTTSAATTMTAATTHTSTGGAQGNTVVIHKPLTRAQKLAAAITACDKLKRKSKRARCVAAAKKRYAATPTRAQKLAAAIKACDKLTAKGMRAKCVAAAKKRYPLQTAGPGLRGTFVVW